MGFVPSSFFMMGRRPNILRAFSRLSREVLGVPGEVPQSLKWLVAHVASRSSGCQYCSAHSGAAAAGKCGCAPEKVAAAFEYETNPMFSAPERAALAFAQSAGAQPNTVTRADFDEMLKHFNEDQIVEITAVICLFGLAQSLERHHGDGPGREAAPLWRDTLGIDRLDCWPPLTTIKYNATGDRSKIGGNRLVALTMCLLSVSVV